MLNSVQDISPSSAPETAQRMHILVLDDSEVDRKRLLRLCDDAGLHFKATEVHDIASMRTAMSAQAFDLIFIDYLLVDEDGLDAINVLKDHPDQAAMSIMIAGEGRIDVAVEAMRRGCTDYLTKSNLSVDALRKAVATALERKMMTLTLAEERSARHRLEHAVQRYADDCSLEMRTLLASTLRRVRKLRSHAKTGEHATDIRELEHNIDRLWAAMPRLSDTPVKVITPIKPQLLPKT